MKTVTIQDVMSWSPCSRYTEKKITALFAGRESMTALDMLKLNIPVEDIFWAVLREELIPAPILHEFACKCAEYALSKVDHPDARSIAAIEAKRKWLRGEITDDELDVAWSAAWSAADAADAAWSAAGSAAWSAADVARAAAMYAARYAAESADKSAAGSAARTRERKRQVEMLLELLESEVEK